MIISAKLCFNSRVDRYCCGCAVWPPCKFEPIRTPFIRLFGSAHGTRKEIKIIMYKCINCYWKDAKTTFANEIVKKLSAEDIATIEQYVYDNIPRAR